MIFCKLERLERYRGQSENLDKAIDFLAKTDLSALPMGRNEIDGDRVFANRFDYDTAEEALTEWHERYIDVHVVVDGQEQVGVLESAGLPIEDAAAEDHTCHVEEFESMNHLRSGYVLITFPEDAHSPKRNWKVPCHIKKVVIKVLDR